MHRGGLGSIIHASGSWVAFGFLYINNFMRFSSGLHDVSSFRNSFASPYYRELEFVQ